MSHYPRVNYLINVVIIAVLVFSPLQSTAVSASDPSTPLVAESVHVKTLPERLEDLLYDLYNGMHELRSGINLSVYLQPNKDQQIATSLSG